MTSECTVLVFFSNTCIRRRDRQFTMCAIKAKRSCTSSEGSRGVEFGDASLMGGRKSLGLRSMVLATYLMDLVATLVSEDTRKFAPTIK